MGYALLRHMGYAAHPGRGWMSTEGRRDDRRRVVIGRDQEGANRHLVFQEVNGYVAVKVSDSDPVYLDPLVVSKAVEHMRELQACALRGVRWII
jgi:hypothetical protein